MRKQIIEDLPNFPTDVIDQWLVPFAETDGWPPTAERWRYLLVNTNLDYWRKVEWSIEKISFESIKLTPDAESQLAGLLEAYLLGVDNIYARNMGKNGIERFQFQLSYLKDNGNFIRPPVLVNHGHGFDIMDGNHRIAAYFALMQIACANQLDIHLISQQAWLGVIPV